MARTDPSRLATLFHYDEERGLPLANKPELAYAQPFLVNGRIYYSVDGGRIRGEDLVWALTEFAWPSARLSFKDGDPLNIRRENLEMPTPRPLDDLLNPAPEAPKYKGVVRIGPNSFKAQLRRQGRTLYLGCFPTAEQARDAVIAKAESFKYS